MAIPREEFETDSLDSLEERVTRAVELVTTLRQERDQLAEKLSASQSENSRLAGELDHLRSERKQVRTRIEKLLGQMDLLGAS
jgi:FtsZ-binding cell division protein ZapB